MEPHPDHAAPPADSQPAPAVEHDPAARRFTLTVDGRVCRADYRLVGRTMVMHHTEVPRELEGRGLAARLVAGALDHARRHDLTVDPQCSYVAAWMARHPETADLRAQRG